eukprot:jgi/Botrbrau1/9418/Bobra.0252s0042.1
MAKNFKGISRHYGLAHSTCNLRVPCGHEDGPQLRAGFDFRFQPREKVGPSCTGINTISWTKSALYAQVPGSTQDTQNEPVHPSRRK